MGRYQLSTGDNTCCGVVHVPPSHGHLLGETTNQLRVYRGTQFMEEPMWWQSATGEMAGLITPGSLQPIVSLQIPSMSTKNRGQEQIMAMDPV